MDRILVTGGRAPAALDLIRQFASAGKQVFVADSAPCFLARASRAVVRAFRVPPPRMRPREFAEAILAIVKSERIAQIVPTCEEVFYLGHCAPALREQTELFCEDLEPLRRLHDKWQFTKLARGLGVQVPDTWHLEEPDDVLALPLPPQELVFKPAYSRFAVHTLVQPESRQLQGLRPSPERPWVAQRFIQGRELCSYAVARDGTLLASAVYEPTWRVGRGAGYYFLPIEAPLMETFVRQFVVTLGYTGQIAFDFIETPDGQVYVLECNPRATSGVHLFSPSDGLAAAFDGTATTVVRPGSNRPGMLAVAMALLGTADAVRSGRLRQWATDFGRGRDAVWSWHDPLPAFYSLVGLGAYVALALEQGISPRAASTRDIEWDGEAIS